MKIDNNNNNLDFDHSIMCLGDPVEFEQDELRGLQISEVSTSSLNENKNAKAVNE